MASSSSGPGAAGGLSWASLVASTTSDLKFVAESRAAVIDGVLHIPKKVVDLGVQRLKSALVIQFLDSVPPLKVVRSVLNRLWGFEGEVVLSSLPDGLYLVELPSVKLCEWVLARSWHIHHSSMLLRRWTHGIKPIDTSPKELPVWITFKDVPPALVTHEGISWLATQIGTPINKFIRDGLDIKVCVVKDVGDEVPQSLTVVMDGGEQNIIFVECREPRKYNRKGKGVYTPKIVPPKSSVAGSGEGTSGSDPKPSPDGEVVTVEAHPEKDAGEGGNSSGSQPGEIDPIQQVSVEETGATVILSPEVAAVFSPKSVSIDEGGTLVSDDDEEVDENIDTQVQLPHPEVAKVPVRRVLGSEGVCKIGNPPFSEFLNSNKVMTPKGIINRPKTRRR
ncbi:hypothetical protein LINPERPRIM_LOCUS30318 [Linum perenne]